MFDKIEKFRAYEAVVRRIEELIRSGQLNRGDKLPPERTIATMLGTSRTTVREACRALERAGVIESRMGAGRFVSRELQRRGLQRVPASSTADPAHLLDFMEARKTIEIQMAELAAQNATEEDIAGLRSLLASEGDTPDDALGSDLAFHSALASVCGNKFLENFFNSELFVMYRWLQFQLSPPSREVERRRRRNSQHRLIVTAVAARDPVAAGDAMREHLLYAEQHLREVLERQQVESIV